MSAELAVTILKAIATQHGNDPEVAHSGADSVLCDFLSALGHDDIVAAWRAVPKWYA